MLLRIVVKLILCLALSLPASALQPEHESIAFTEFRPSLSYQSPTLVFNKLPSSASVFNQDALTYFFSGLLAMMVLLAVRAQQKQDFSTFRMKSSPSVSSGFNLHHFGHKTKKA